MVFGSVTNTAAMGDDPYRSSYHDHPHLKQLVVDFARDVPADIKSISGCCEDGRIKKAIEQVHRLKGTSATFGFAHLAASLSSFEAQLKEFPPGAGDLAPIIRESLDGLSDLGDRIRRTYP